MSRLVGLVSAGLLFLGGGQALAATDGSVPASPSIARTITHVSARTLNAVGAGPIKANQGTQQSGAFTITKLHAARRSGKPPILFATDLAWCDHCAANSWALAIALSRFGTFRGLRQINIGSYASTHNGTSPLYDNLEGLSFYGVRYTSKLLSLNEVTLQDKHGRQLQRLTRAQLRDLNSFDTAGYSPAYDIGGRYGFVNSAFTPLLLYKQSAAAIAGTAAAGSAGLGQSIDGLANVLTAAICSATGGKPHAVCVSPGVRAGARVL